MLVIKLVLSYHAYHICFLLLCTITWLGFKFNFELSKLANSDSVFSF